MASPASTETIEIRRRGRRRLIGVVAIVVLLVVFVPMLLDSQPRHAADGPSTQIPPQENAPPLPPPSPAKKVAPPAASPASAAPEKATPPVASLKPEAAKPAAAPSPASSAKTPAPVVAQAAPRLEGFAVQVGAFRDEETLKQARSKLAAAGVVHYTERLGEGANALTRLRAGPFPTREAAESARATLRKASIDGQVVALP
ncbi:MAG TPA: SPOR domain-containing protein [Usitatibacter sp.]|nr:SPOR domain-containing protein [Usitatibacter sp.]